MSKSLVVVGVTSYYLEKEDVRKFLQSCVTTGYSLTFFHPLRITATSPVSSNVANKITRFEDFIEAVGKASLQKDASNFIKRLKLFKREVLPKHHGGLIRVVFHTEYSIPFWCSRTFRKLYLEVIPSLVSAIREELREYPYEIVVEVHPGFTDLNNCFVKVWKKRIIVVCKSLDKVGRDLGKLIDCLRDFKREVTHRLTEERASMCMEPRAGSIVYVNKSYVPQTLENHCMTVLFAEKVGMGIVLDPGQSTEKMKGGGRHVEGALQRWKPVSKLG